MVYFCLWVDLVQGLAWSAYNEGLAVPLSHGAVGVCIFLSCVGVLANAFLPT